ncbi:TlpA family protein disulfide reductase [Mucilaginibacter sp.]|jgi:thiol-disulfide isomerase/thioredoxin|uniref:TlpA family protein disulfide reductase n=1 Tax=Mucilaginibacter sp. TaxID=1882438 RepID=UPI00356373A2
MIQLILTLHLLCATPICKEIDTTSYPKIGRKCPSFIFEDVQYYSRSKMSLKDFKGRWLVLDCWNRYCSVCLERMPGLDSLSKLFPKQICFMLVGYTGSRYTHRSDNKVIHDLYPKLKKNLNINLPIAYDSVLFHRFEVGPCPYVIVIDPSGIVRAVTTHLDKQAIKDLLAGRKPHLDKALNRKGF